MKRGFVILILIIILVILGIVVWFVYKSQENNISNSCTELGCESNDVYVGSINSDKYYSCDCHYAKQIKPENIICFTSDDDALSKGYVKSEC